MNLAKQRKSLLIVSLLIFYSGSLFCQNKNTVQKTQTGTIESKSKVNWVTRDFSSELSLDAEKADIKLPSGKKIASNKLKSKMPQLIQSPLLSLFADSRSSLADKVIEDKISINDVFKFISGGYKTPDTFTHDLKKLNTTNTNNINEIGKLFRLRRFRFWLWVLGF